MSTSLFQAEDWVYVADSMGRLGQGYYKNRNNPSKTITPSEFESRRSQPATITSNNKEQNINKINEPSTTSPSNGPLTSSESGSVELTPWDNPIVGEETASTASQSAVTQKKYQLHHNLNRNRPKRKNNQARGVNQETVKVLFQTTKILVLKLLMDPMVVRDQAALK